MNHDVGSKLPILMHPTVFLEEVIDVPLSHHCVRSGTLDNYAGEDATKNVAPYKYTGEKPTNAVARGQIGIYTYLQPRKYRWYLSGVCNVPTLSMAFAGGGCYGETCTCR